MLQDTKRKYLTRWSVGLLIATPLVALVYYDNFSIFFAVLSIMLGTLLYHMAIRLGISWFVAYMPEDYFNWKLKIYKIKPFERKLYHKIRLREWEGYLPYYNAKDFKYEKEKGNEEEILFNMCEDELIHMLNAIASLLPIIIGSILFPKGWVAFVISSLLACLYELAFVASQRFDSAWLIKVTHLNDQPHYLRDFR